jgi:hypothetical protein
MSNTQLVTQQTNDALLEKVILQNDLAGLSPNEKVQHVKNVCDSLGLNPLTKPIQLHKWQGKEVMYMAKDGTEQIRNLHNVSIVKLETEFLKNDLYIVRAYAMKNGGRQDCSTSAQSVAGLKGDALCNAIKKCETQAKRRVTLSICGLGMLDETELENLPKEPQVIAITAPIIEEEVNNLDLQEILKNINSCMTMDELKHVYVGIIKDHSLKGNKEAMKIIILAKNKRKLEIEHQDFINELDNPTEVTNAQPDTEC